MPTPHFPERPTNSGPLPPAMPDSAYADSPSIQKAIGQLEAKVDIMTSQVGDMSKRMNRLEIAVYSSLAGLAMIAWFLNKSIDIALALKK